MIRTVLTWLAVVAILVGGTAYYVFTLKRTAPLPNSQPIVEAPKPPPAPSVGFSASGKQKVLITWGNLPEGTNQLRIFRTKKGTTNWKLWKTIPITDRAGGSAELLLGGGEFTIQYSFYAEAGTASLGTGGAAGITFWTSSSTEALPPPPPPSQTGNGSGTTTQSSGAGDGTTPPTQSTSSQSSNPAGQGTSTTPGTTPPPSGDVYYTPSGEISGVLATTSEPFYVQHANNRNIEINWQNLPLATDNIIIYRSAGSSGPWEQLFAQNNPVVPGHGSIELLDLTIDQNQYYKLVARDGGSTLATYSPVLLPAL